MTLTGLTQLDQSNIIRRICEAIAGIVAPVLIIVTVVFLTPNDAASRYETVLKTVWKFLLDAPPHPGDTPDLREYGGRQVFVIKIHIISILENPSPEKSFPKIARIWVDEVIRGEGVENMKEYAMKLRRFQDAGEGDKVIVGSEWYIFGYIDNSCIIPVVVPVTRR